MSPEDALQVLTRRTGQQFDPEVVEAFQRVMDKRLAGRRATGKLVVLLVDPDPKFRRVLKVRLGNLGLKVRVASDHERCKEQLLKDTPDLALIGIDEDPNEAFQLLGEIQQDDALCRIPIAFLATRSARALASRISQLAASASPVTKARSISSISVRSRSPIASASVVRSPRIKRHHGQPGEPGPAGHRADPDHRHEDGVRDAVRG